MDKKLWLAVDLSLLVLAGWSTFFEKKPLPRPGGAAAASGPAVPGGAPAAAASAASAAAPAAAAPAADPAQTLASALPMKLGEASALVAPRGAALASVKQPEPLGVVELVAKPESGLFSTFADLSFERDPKLKDDASFVAVRHDGLKVYKQFVPGGGNVLAKLSVTATNPTRQELPVGPWTLDIGPGLGTIESEKKENPKLLRVIGLKPVAEGLRGSVETLKAGVEHPLQYRWVAVDNRYFLAAVLPAWEHFGPVTVPEAGHLRLTAKPVTLKPGQSFTWVLPYYLGPKGQTVLTSYGFGLEKAVDFGFFWQIGRPILNALWWLQARTGNWGWAIIVLTLGLQCLLFPLTYKSLKAAAAMKKIQPEMARLQQRYKDDPARLNAEMMKMYKEKGANPLGGCLPMLAQMPIFVALFNVLRGSWELHGAGWVLWLTDLSAKDPYYVLPIVMGGLMWLQSKLNPPSADPAQQQVMMFMPLIFTFMFLNFPSGLVLYWLTNSLVSTALQLALKKRLEA